MIVIFCSDPMNSRQVDANYQVEYSAALQAGFQPLLISFNGGWIQEIYLCP